MTIQEIKLTKSRTFGINLPGRTSYQKVEISMGAVLTPQDIVTSSYAELSNTIEESLKKEISILKENFKSK